MALSPPTAPFPPCPHGILLTYWILNFERAVSVYRLYCVYYLYFFFAFRFCVFAFLRVFSFFAFLCFCVLLQLVHIHRRPPVLPTLPLPLPLSLLVSCLFTRVYVRAKPSWALCRIIESVHPLVHPLVQVQTYAQSLACLLQLHAHAPSVHPFIRYYCRCISFRVSERVTVRQM
ncbi:hypothetical protein DENSPDRAFT_627690 [Dentipellis sp. KUC8613]|nr:hypothetical protein DENSPDRAFT_627690 [Dentipellis sp. KUC8613]